MALDLVAIHEKVAQAVVDGTARQVRGYPFQTGGAYELPCIVVTPGDEYINYHVDMGLECDVNLILEVRAPTRVSLEDGLRVLAELLSKGAGLPNSVIDAIDADPTLGGLVERIDFGVAGQWVGFGADSAEGPPTGVIVTLPVQIWTTQS